MSNSFFENDLKNLLASITIISIYKDIHKIDKNIFYDHKVTNRSWRYSESKDYLKKIFILWMKVIIQIHYL